MEKKNKVIITTLVIIIVLLLALCILFNVKSNNKENITLENFYDINNLEVKEYGSAELFKDIKDKENYLEKISVYDEEASYDAILSLNGDVLVDGYVNEKSYNGKLNVDKIIDIVKFDVPSDISNQLMYMLDEEGYVYSYKFGNINDSNYEVVKVDNLSNVKKIFISEYHKANAGGSWALFAITNNNECVMINIESV